MVERFGEITPVRLHQASVEDIQSCGMSFRKAEYVKGIAEACANGGLDLEVLKTLPDEEVVKALISLKGIGPWTAEMMLIFSLGRKDVVSWGDLAIRRGMMLALRTGIHGQEGVRQISVERMRLTAACASLYIWELAHKPELLIRPSRKTV
ncbi:MAG: hypothetical protein MZV70_43830 [Desulfobacterales bacterium]|nr:hypothetical protein [Desulfobacterales bacterium]